MVETQRLAKSTIAWRGLTQIELANEMGTPVTSVKQDQ